MGNTAKTLSNQCYIGDPLTKETEATASVEIAADGGIVTANILGYKPILDLLLDAGKKPPYSCKAGVCMACMAVVESGTVTQEDLGPLSTQDVLNGKFLACQAYPASKKVKIRFLG